MRTEDRLTGPPERAAVCPRYCPPVAVTKVVVQFAGLLRGISSGLTLSFTAPFVSVATNATVIVTLYDAWGGSTVWTVGVDAAPPVLIVPATGAALLAEAERFRAASALSAEEVAAYAEVCSCAAVTQGTGKVGLSTAGRGRGGGGGQYGVQVGIQRLHSTAGSMEPRNWDWWGLVFLDTKATPSEWAADCLALTASRRGLRATASASSGTGGPRFWTVGSPVDMWQNVS